MQYTKYSTVLVIGFVFCFLVFPPESLPGDDVLCFHALFLMSAFFPVYFGVTFSIRDHRWIRSGPVNNVR